VDLGNGVLRAPVGPEAVGDRLKVGLEDRFQDQFQRGLHDPVGHGRDAQRPQFPAGLGNHHSPHRGRCEGPRPQLITDLVQERFHSVPGDDPDHGGPVDPGGARTLVTRDAFPRHGQHLRVAHQVVQIIEPAAAVSGRPAVQFVLNLPYRHIGLAVAGPSGGAGIHRRVFGPDSHFLLLSLPPFPRWPALPASEYYGGSAPSTPFGRQRAYPQVGNGVPMVPTFTVVRSTDEAPGFAPAVSSWLRRRPSPRPARPDTFTVPTVPAPCAAWLTATASSTHRTPAQIHRVRAGRRSRGFTTPVPHVHLPVSLTRHGPSGSAEPP